MADQLHALSREWNDVGRSLATDVQARLGRFHKGEVDDPALPSDPRDAALAARVLDAVVELNQLGRWQEARRWFDPAHEPFFREWVTKGFRSSSPSEKTKRYFGAGARGNKVTFGTLRERV